MTAYLPPLADIQFALRHPGHLGEISNMPRFAHAEPDLVDGILEEAGRFAAEVIAPLYRVGDMEGSTLAADGSVRTPTGYRAAYRRFVEAGWPAVSYPENHGGGGFPAIVGLAIQELVTTADLAFSLCPMLTYGANEVLIAHGDAEQQAMFLPKLISGEWTGTMVLTEPQAGSDLGALTTKAVHADDGSWRITGTKIFITWGEHDMADNIVHLVLARAADGPPGTKGVSCFVVPRNLVAPDGTPGDRNDVRCVSVEHKLGIHASPTCVLAFGDEGEGAVGYLIGELHQGMRYMFTMMNHARLNVGCEGLAIAERAYQASVAHATQRNQGRAVGAPRTEPSPIIDHPDVRRMLMIIRAQAEAMRAVMYRNAAAIDLASHHPDPGRRAAEEDLAAILTPVSKAWATDLGVEMASLAIQVHGGMGYIEETGVAQLLRDARIAPIYEGTNGIQAIDLVMRKLPLSGGASIEALLDEMRRTAGEAATVGDGLGLIGERLGDAVNATAEAVTALGLARRDAPKDALAGATPFLRMLGITVGGWLLACQAMATAAGEGPDDEFRSAKQATARFYAEHLLPATRGLLSSAMAGSRGVFGIDAAALAR